MTVMTITFGDDYKLDFNLEPSPIAQLWLEKMEQRYQWALDDPRRFYGFVDRDSALDDAEQRLRHCIQVINSHEKIIEKDWTSVDDQDYLNYLHNIFERYHGLLDQQNTEWWHRAPDSVRKALADLNICVHRAESAAKQNRPRFVCTWFGMPKNSMLSQDVIEQYGTICYEFGGVYLNYVEIGKTVEDLSEDDDRYIGDSAFQPFLRYSADFNVRFYDSMADIAKVYRYFESHRQFFESKGIRSFDDYRSMPRRYKVAQLCSELDRESILSAIAQRQHITDIYLS